MSITDGFWGTRQEVNAGATLDHLVTWQERAGWLANFDLVAAGVEMSSRRGREFSDSEVYKCLEAIVWELGRRPDHVLAARFDALVDRVAAAQDEDGYLNTNFGHNGQAGRYTDLEWGHELYCQGHLLQAAVACLRTGRRDHRLVEVAQRSAEHVCSAFGPDGIQRVCGHAEIEVALAEFGRATGNPAYTEQARLFLERRGTHVLDDIEWTRAYFQDDVPIREATVFRGHAVRANYLAAAAVDVGSDFGDSELLDAVERQWRATMSRRTYVTGGQGSRHQDEGFGEDYALPPDRAYSETCAAVGSIMVAWRLLLQTGKVEYADAIERALFNVVATSPRDDGRAFYYANTLHQRVPGVEPADDQVSRRALSSLRAPWFEVTCCPPNVARTLASLDTMLAATDDRGVWLHQYATSTITTDLGSARLIELQVRTDYPNTGHVTVDVREAPETWQLTLRVPAWARGARLTVGPDDLGAIEPGWVTITGPAAGVRIVLDLDMTPTFLRAHPRVDAVRGCVAVQRGPEVWCLESVDLPDGCDVDTVAVDVSKPPRWADGRVVIRAALPMPGPPDDTPHDTPAYTVWLDDSEPSARPADLVEVPLTPYHRWARRGPSTMRVWIPFDGVGGAV